MKKLLILLATFAIGLASQARTVNNIFAEFRAMPGANYIHSQRPLPASALEQATQLPSGLAGVEDIEVLDLGDCAPAVKDSFGERIQQAELEGYRLYASRNESDTHTRIFTRSKGKRIAEMLVFTWGQTGASLTRARGNIICLQLEVAMASK